MPEVEMPSSLMGEARLGHQEALEPYTQMMIETAQGMDTGLTGEETAAAILTNVQAFILSRHGRAALDAALRDAADDLADPDA